MKMKKGTLWKNSFINLICLAMLTTFLPPGNFTERMAVANDDFTLTENISAPKVRTEIVNKRTANSKTYLNPDGTYTSEISQTPIHYKNSRNTWSEIESNLIENTTEENFQNKANSFKAKLDKKIDKDTPLLQVEDQDRSIKLELAPLENTGKQPTEVTGIVEDNSIQYPEIYQNISLIYTIGADRIKEDIVFNEKPLSGFPEKFTYKMDLEGLYAKEFEEVLYLYDEDTNQPIYYFETPYMYDSYKPEGFQTAKEITSIPEEAISYDVKIEHEVIDGQLYLYLIPNNAWLENPERIYPITIDPTIVKLQSSNYVKDTNLRSTFPTQTGGNDLELGGGASNGNVLRSLIKFDLASMPEATILSSSLNLWFSSTNGSTPIDISLFKVSKDWEENQASWNYAMTSPSVAWTNKGGDYVVSNKLATVSGITSPTSLDLDMKKWEVPTHIIENWRSSTDPNYGLLLKSDSESTNIYKKFVSSEHTFDSKYHPLLVVTYRTNARLGLEDYWDYESQPLVGGGTTYANLSTGNNIVQYTDFSLLGRAGFGLDFTRTYNSKSQESSVFGYGWTFTGNEKLFLNIKGTANILNYSDADGTDHEFTYDVTNGKYHSGPGKYSTITKSPTDSTIYTMEDKYGYKTTFKILQSSSDTNVKVAYIQTQQDRNGNKITYTYDTANNNRITKITSDLGNGLLKSIDFKYDNGLVQEISYENISLAFTYENGMVTAVKQVDSSSNVISTTVFNNSNGLLRAVIDPNNRRTDFTYELGYLRMVQPPSEINGLKDPSTRPGTVYSLDTAKKIATVKDPKGNLTTFYMNDNYVVEKFIDPFGLVTVYSLDENYNILNESLNGIVKTKNTFDSNGNLLSTTDLAGNVQKYAYTSFSNVLTEIDSNNKVTKYTYESKGNLKSMEIDPDTSIAGDSLITSYEYDSFGDLLFVTHPNGSKDSITNNYATYTRTYTNTDSFGNVTTSIADWKGNLLEREDAKKQKYTFGYNDKNELESVKNPKMQLTRYEYDLNGNKTAVINANNQKAVFEYNEQNQLVYEKNAIDESISYSYDANGNMTNTLLPVGKITKAYDVLDRLTELYSDGVLKWKWMYENEKLLSIYKGGTLSKSFTYYPNDFVKSIKEGNNLLEYGYMGAEYNSQVKYTIGSANSTVLDFIPDDVYRTKELKRNGLTVASFKYDTKGLLEAVTYSNGISLNMKYESGRLLSYKIISNKGEIVDSFTYEYDENHSIKKITSNGSIRTYEYDELNQLKSESLPDGSLLKYQYDAVGNRTEKQTIKEGISSNISYFYNGANQLIKAGDQTYNYDKNGNLISDGSRYFTFNTFGQMETVKDLYGRIIANYQYDEQGKRVKSIIGSRTINYYYDGDKVLYETDQDNIVLREYMYDDSGNPLTLTTKGITYNYLFNPRGDIIGLVDPSGNIVASYDYDAWGNILSQSGSLAAENPYRYAGYRYDEETKLYYLLARYYNPEKSVFLSLDPLRGELNNPISQNGYAYSENNPIMYFDPDGNSPRQRAIDHGRGPAPAQGGKSGKSGLSSGNGAGKISFDLKTPDSFKNAKVSDVEKYLDKTLKGFTKKPLKKGEGFRYYDGKGNSYQINYGYKNASDKVHGGPYFKATIGNQIIRIPLIK